MQFDIDKRKAIHLGTENAGFIYVECAEEDSGIIVRVSVCALQCDIVTNRAKATHGLKEKLQAELDSTQLWCSHC